MTGRITRAEDFELVLKSHSLARSPHFAMHHLAKLPSRPTKASVKSAKSQLSTGVASVVNKLVDDTPRQQPKLPGSDGVWLGMVVPKRHAKRAVTRTLLRRQIKAAMESQTQVPPGLWIVRLRAPFDRTVYVSAASKALADVAREELLQLVSSAIQRGTAA